MPALESLDTADAYYATSFRELGHVTGHERRVLDRKEPTVNYTSKAISDLLDRSDAQEITQMGWRLVLVVGAVVAMGASREAICEAPQAARKQGVASIQGREPNRAVQKKAASIPTARVRRIRLEFARSTYERTHSDEPRSVTLNKREWAELLGALKTSSRRHGLSEPLGGWGSPTDSVVVEITGQPNVVFEVMGPPLAPKISDQWGAKFEIIFERYRARAFPAKKR